MRSGCGCLLLVALTFVNAGETRAAAETGAVAEVVGIVTNFLRAAIAEAPKKARLADGTKVRTVLLGRTEWELRNMPQSSALSSQMESKALALPETERLKMMDRFDDYTQLWFVSLQDYPEADGRLKRVIPPNQQSHRYYRELAFLGRGKGQAWYAYMPLYDWTSLQNQLGLARGDDPLAAAVRGAAVDDTGNLTRGSAEKILGAAGSKGIPYIKQLLATTNFGVGLNALGAAQEKAATPLLLESAASPNKALAVGARYILEVYPRAEAEALYFKWLAQDARQLPVFQLLPACEKVAPKKLTPYLPSILASPKSTYEYRRAFELSRPLDGKGIPAKLLQAELEIKEFGYASSTNYNQAKVDRAVREMLKTDDPRGACVIAISLATLTMKGDWRPANQAGRTILRGLPDRYGRKVAERVANSLADPWTKQKLNEAAR